jgi:hypothetical protein
MLLGMAIGMLPMNPAGRLRYKIVSCMAMYQEVFLKSLE